MFVCVCVCVCSQQPVPEKLQIRVNRISMAAYESLHYDKDQLKEACESAEGSAAACSVKLSWRNMDAFHLI